MDKIQNTNKYQDLYKKYKELVNKTTIRVYKVVSGEKINIDNISPKDLMEREEIEKELTKGLDFLTDNQLIDLSGDTIFTDMAFNILKKRKETL